VDRWGERVPVEQGDAEAHAVDVGDTLRDAVADADGDGDGELLPLPLLLDDRDGEAHAVELLDTTLEREGLIKRDPTKPRALELPQHQRATAAAPASLEPAYGQARMLPLGLATRAASGTEAWRALRAGSRTLRDETVLIVGYGAIGRRLTELLRPFGVGIMAYRRRERGDTTDARVETLGDAFDDPAFAGGVATLKHNHEPVAGFDDPVVEFYEFTL
jgi:hypothetical protein